MSEKANCYIGTSGWSYAHWKSNFYPAGLKSTDQLGYMAEIFNSVELNGSFYRLPAEKTFINWKEKVPADFVFAVKASRYITHMKKLQVGPENIHHFLDRVLLLKEKLGVVLFQLPPGLKKDMDLLQDFIRLLPAGLRYAFEFRNHTWYEDEVYQLLTKHQMAFCIYELERHLSPLKVTAAFVYVRLHGPGNKYEGNYTEAQLQEWKKRIAAWLALGKDVYVYFDNDQNGYAAFNAGKLTKMLEISRS